MKKQIDTHISVSLTKESNYIFADMCAVMSRENDLCHEENYFTMLQSISGHFWNPGSQAGFEYS